MVSANGEKNKYFKRSKALEKMIEWMDWVTYDLPPGPPRIPQRYYINLHKGGMLLYIFGLMVYYDNWSMGAWLYLAMHGSYVIFWLMKDFVFPD